MIANQIKTVLLLGLLTGILIAVGGIIGGQYGLLLGLIIAIVMNFSTYWFSDKFVLKMYKAKPLTKDHAPTIHKIVKEIAEKANIPKPKIYLIPTNNSNAFATGRNKDHAVVAVTQGILKLLDEDELKGVIAHEMAHIKNKDMLVSTIAATIAGVIFYLAMMARFAAIFGGFRGGRNSQNAIQFLVMAIVAPIIALIVRMAISRSREYMADERGAKFIKDGKPLASALRKLQESSKDNPLKFGSEATSHMFIVNPFVGKSLLNIFSTHPNVNKRIEKLNQLTF